MTKLFYVGKNSIFFNVERGGKISAVEQKKKFPIDNKRKERKEKEIKIHS